MELAPDGVLVCDLDGVILMANRRVETMFGFDRDTLIGAPVETLLPPRLHTAHRNRLREYAAAPATRRMGVYLNVHGCHALGTEFPIDVTLSPVTSGDSSAIVAAIRENGRQDTAMTGDEDERIAADLRDRVIGRLLRAGLALAGLLERSQVDREVAERIREARDELDCAVAELDDPRLFPTAWSLGAFRRPTGPDEPDLPGAS
jgi:PAS domain S-box-containing protein